jgi:tetratricopeptide (TPR) repeat protein
VVAAGVTADPTASAASADRWHPDGAELSLMGAGPAPGAMTDYQIELARIDKDIAELQGSALIPPVDTERATRYVHGLYQRAALTGNLAELEAADAKIDAAIRQIPYPGDLYFLKANLAFKLHRLADVRRNLEAVPSVLESLEGQALRADLDFQEGRYEAAKKKYESLIAENRTWDNLVRLAYFTAKMGDAVAADRLYLEAEDELTAKEMRSYAWVELQRGLLHLAHGQHDDAEARYRRADRAYSGYWLVDEHRAELLGAQGRFVEAAALYESVVARVPRPELQQALGELYAAMGNAERAQPWHARALAGYLDSAQRGGVHYYHHLVDFYADVAGNGAEAVKWAHKDIALRDNFSTQATLAWALYRDGQFVPALERMEQALSSGARYAHLLSQAAAIYRTAGRAAESEQFRQQAAAMNPCHSGFHVHR